MVRTLKADMHVHTRFSKDSLSGIDAVLDAAVKQGLRAVAITDHDELAGALEAQRLARKRSLPLQVIIGEEVGTEEGDLLAYFVKKRIAPGPLEDVLAEAGRQKAVCCAAHPYDFARHGIDLRGLAPDVLGQLDAVEVLNARVPLASMNARAMGFALQHRKAILAGSDAHHPSEVGAAYAEFYGVRRLDAAALMHAQRRIGGKRSPPFVRIHSRYAVLRKRLSDIFPY
jgi:predicted metal-dependent phosphoesterase TrpH